LVGVLSDKYVRAYKGQGRPIQPEGERLALVESIRYVDRAFLTDEDPYGENAIKKIRPAVIVIGLEEGKNERKRNHAARIVAAVPGTRIEFLERYRSGEVSTSNIIDRIHYVEAPDSQGLP
jgi:bifunctional ADP-heptose synthase (sugar kinase/adenylyltransferase)